MEHSQRPLWHEQYENEEDFALLPPWLESKEELARAFAEYKQDIVQYTKEQLLAIITLKARAVTERGGGQSRVSRGEKMQRKLLQIQSEEKEREEKEERERREVGQVYSDAIEKDKKGRLVASSSSSTSRVSSTLSPLALLRAASTSASEERRGDEVERARHASTSNSELDAGKKEGEAGLQAAKRWQNREEHRTSVEAEVNGELSIRCEGEMEVEAKPAEAAVGGHSLPLQATAITHDSMDERGGAGSVSVSDDIHSSSTLHTIDAHSISAESSLAMEPTSEKAGYDAKEDRASVRHHQKSRLPSSSSHSSGASIAEESGGEGEGEGKKSRSSTSSQMDLPLPAPSTLDGNAALPAHKSVMFDTTATTWPRESGKREEKRSARVHLHEGGVAGSINLSSSGNVSPHHTHLSQLPTPSPTSSPKPSKNILHALLGRGEGDAVASSCSKQASPTMEERRGGRRQVQPVGQRGLAMSGLSEKQKNYVRSKLEMSKKGASSMKPVHLMTTTRLGKYVQKEVNGKSQQQRRLDELFMHARHKSASTKKKVEIAKHSLIKQ
mmetsp:Transcript_7601/g.19688  ORF Transcript_7601/g.19688 Transcript_7601/m.19688 type:complete len:556 (-) Transcript_7601:2340-4007(-)